MSHPPDTVTAMVSPSGRHRAESHIRRALTAGHNPWEALDTYRDRGGRIRWDDWFRLWRRLATEPPLAGRPALGREAARCR